MSEGNATARAIGETATGQIPTDEVWTGRASRP